MPKRKNAFTRIGRKAKTHGLITALALISILGFALNAITIFTGYEFFGTFAYASIILGLGLMAEAGLRDALRRARNKPTSNLFAKSITFMVGLVVFIGGILTIPSFGITASPNVAAVIGVGNIMAVFVILMEWLVIE